MRVLCTSSDIRELTGLVKRLVWVGIRCAVCKESIDSRLSVWIQQDSDFPVALKILVERDKPRPLPHWASALDLPVSATVDFASTATEGFSFLATEGCALAAADGIDTTSVVLVQSRGPTRTGSA